MKLRFLTAGESHGKGLIGILEGLPSGLNLDKNEIQFQLGRRKKGYGRGSRQKIEDDAFEFLSGVRHGTTLGSPICLVIWNKDFKNWTEIMQSEPFEGKVKREVHIPRPGHSDYIGGAKYQHTDMRNVLERSSARETAIRVALGSVARKFLQESGIKIGSRVISIGSANDESTIECTIEELIERTEASCVRCLDTNAEKLMVNAIDAAKKAGDTLGGIFEVYAYGLPLGIGSYVHWDRRLEGDIAKSFMSLNAIKGVEVGLGMQSGRVLGSECHDEMYWSEKNKSVYFKTNHSGGLIGGMTSGMPLVIRSAMKPIATLMKPLNSVNLEQQKAALAHVERSDVCAVPAAAVIAESLLCLDLANYLLDKFGGDSMNEYLERLHQWNENYAHNK